MGTFTVNPEHASEHNQKLFLFVHTKLETIYINVMMHLYSYCTK